ncbi:hypothetical protein K8T06_10070 [bacterium]|nr:hypothetical protein [bacterium]
MYREVINGEVVVTFNKLNGYVKSHVFDSEVTDIVISKHCQARYHSPSSITMWNEMDRIKNLSTREKRLDQWRSKIKGSRISFMGHVKRFNTDGSVRIGIDNETNIEVVFEDDLSKINKMETKVCFSCGGSGQSDCPQCVDGQYQDIIQKKWVSCPYCNGVGWTPCTFCNGTGKR